MAIDGIVRCTSPTRARCVAENFARNGEVGAAVAVTVDGKPVVDLWA